MTVSGKMQQLFHFLKEVASDLWHRKRHVGVIFEDEVIRPRRFDTFDKCVFKHGPLRFEFSRWNRVKMRDCAFEPRSKSGGSGPLIEFRHQ